MTQLDSLLANLFRLVETVAKKLRIPYTHRRRDRLNSTVASRRRRRCVLGLSIEASSACTYIGSVVSLPNNNSGASSAHFPSVCWLFGKRLHARLRRPIGLVSVTYSDSYIDEWLPSHVIDTCKTKYTDRLVDSQLKPSS